VDCEVVDLCDSPESKPSGTTSAAHKTPAAAQPALARKTVAAKNPAKKPAAVQKPAAAPAASAPAASEQTPAAAQAKPTKHKINLGPTYFADLQIKEPGWTIVQSTTSAKGEKLKAPKKEYISPHGKKCRTLPEVRQSPACSGLIVCIMQVYTYVESGGDATRMPQSDPIAIDPTCTAEEFDPVAAGFVPQTGTSLRLKKGKRKGSEDTNDYDLYNNTYYTHPSTKKARYSWVSAFKAVTGKNVHGNCSKARGRPGGQAVVFETETVDEV